MVVPVAVVEVTVAVLDVAAVVVVGAAVVIGPVYSRHVLLRMWYVCSVSTSELA